MPSKDIFEAIFSPKQYIPHGHCYLWQTPLVGLHVISDLLIAIAYFSIPAMLLYFVCKRPSVSFSNLFVLFGAFIILCGTGHLIDIWTLWYPVYWLSGIEHAITALVSCYTALRLVELLPRFLAMKSPEELEVINQQLQQEVVERQRAEEALRTIATGTASVTGEAFFPVLVRQLAQALNVTHVLVSEVLNDSPRLRSLAFWSEDRLVDTIEYAISDVPGEATLQAGNLCFFSDRLRERFPQSPLLEATAESYIAVPLIDAAQQVIGHLYVMHTAPLIEDENTHVLIQVFAARAATELQRKWAEDEKRRAYEDLELRIEERTASLQQEIQEKIMAESALRRSEAAHRALLEGIPDLIMRISGEGIYLDLKPTSSFSMLQPDVACRGNHISQVLPAGLYEQRWQGIQHALQTGKIQTYEQEARFSDKTQIEEVRIVPCAENEALVIVRDITNRKMIEAALKSSQAFLDRVINAVSDPIVVKDQQHRWTMVNNALCQFLGKSRETLLGRSDYEILPEAEARRFGETDDYVFASGQEVEDEVTLTDVTGNCRILSTKKVAFTTASGSQSLVGVARDITDRKQLELALRQTAKREIATTRILQQMRQSLDLSTIFGATTHELRQVIGCDRVLVYRFNSDWSGVLVAESVADNWSPVIRIPANPSLTQIVINQPNCTARELANSDHLIQDTYLQETQGGPYRRGAHYRSVADIYEAEFDRCYLDFLEQLQARAYLIVPILSGNQLWGLLATYQNDAPRQWESTEIKMVAQIGVQLGVAVQQAELFTRTQQQAEELKLAKEAADAANCAKSEFLANMSHELRTPLNAILGFTQLMRRSSLSNEQRESIDIINRSGEHLLALINDILEMSKIESGRIVLNESSFNLHQLLDGLEVMVRLKAELKRLQLVFDRKPDIPAYIKTDEKKLRQVLLNLLSNAIKFTQAGSVTLQVTVGNINKQQPDLTPRDLNRHMLTFAVQDTGSGVAPNELEKLFAAFEQTQTGLNHREGTGLGLSISQTYVRLLGGEITVDSELGRGSTFTFAIPVEVVDALHDSPPQTLSSYVVGLASGQPAYRILVVEDKPASRLLLVKLLRSLGFKVQEAENGIEAIDIWQRWHPHLIWMDMQMPVMNGYTATSHIKQMAARQADKDNQPVIGQEVPPLPKIIALTASAFEEQRREVLACGCDDFVRKPFREQEIFLKLAEHLGVKYRYESTPDTPPGNMTPNFVLNATDLQIMPSDWIDQLHCYANQGNDVQILRLIQQVPATHADIVHALTTLVEHFQFSQIRQLTQRCQP